MKSTMILIVALAVNASANANDDLIASGDSKLPEDDGIAAKFDADAGIEKHESVIFSDDFEVKGEGDWKNLWDDIRDKDGQLLSLVPPPGGDPKFGKHCLQSKATLDHDTGGGATKWFKSSDTLFIRFYARFDEKCDYVHHFATLRANKSLQGKNRWSGFGKAGLKPNGDDRFSTALEPWGGGGKNPAPGKWNFYSYWHEMKPAPDKNFWGNQFRPDEQPNIERGKWICCEFMLKHNSPDKRDGEQAFWIDGKLLGRWDGISWRKTPTLMANAFTLESYVTDRWTKNKINIVQFDNVVIATEYIGPSK